MALNREFVMTMKTKQGPKEFVLFAGLLDLGHQMGLIAIENEVIETLSDPEKGWWVVRSTGRFRCAEGEAVWSAHGDAGPANSQMHGAYLRHAETRAAARMLRMATNVSMTAFEEMGPDADETTTGSGAAVSGVREQGGSQRREAASRQQLPEGSARERGAVLDTSGDRRAAAGSLGEGPTPPAVAPVDACEECGQVIEDARVAPIARAKFGRVLCVPCGKELLAVERANLPTGEVVAA